MALLGSVFPQEKHPFPRSELRRRWLEKVRAPEVDCFVIELKGVAGFAAIKGPELLHFGTAMETWGSGLASSAHDEILERFVALGVRRARLRVAEANGRARRFYEKHGWQPNGERTQTTFPPHPYLLGYERPIDLPT